MSNPKQDSSATRMASKANPLDQHLNKIRDAKTLDEKKAHAIAMAEDFAVGGRDAFIESIKAAGSMMIVDRIAYNAALKGEGMSTKRF